MGSKRSIKQRSEGIEEASPTVDKNQVDKFVRSLESRRSTDRSDNQRIVRSVNLKSRFRSELGH